MKSDNTKVLKGVVLSTKMNKTIVVKVNRKIKHKSYIKIIVKSSKYMVHDEHNKCIVGDIITFKKVAPISKKKYCILIKN